MKVSINQEECIVCGACEQVCSEVFIIERGEKASIIEKYQTKGPDKGEVSDDLGSCMQEAVDGCPVEVINVEQS